MYIIHNILSLIPTTHIKLYQFFLPQKHLVLIIGLCDILQ